MLADPQFEKISQCIDRLDLEEAERKLDSLADSHQQSVGWWYLRGLLALRQGLLDDAAEHLERAVDLEPGNAQALFQLAFVVDLLGDDERAIDLYMDCIADPPLNVNAMINLAVLLEDLGHYTEAEAYLRQVLKHYPNHKRAALFLKDVVSSQDMFYDEDLERSREKRNAVLDIPISDFELSVRSRNCLKKMDINTLGELLNTTEAELLSYKNFGETSLNEIKAMLSQKGLRLGQALEDDQFKATGRAPATQDADQPSGDPLVMSTPVAELELSVRSRKCLQRLGIATVGDLAMRTEADLLGSKNFGQTSLDEIKQRLATYGLSLRKIDDNVS